jgi:hypothetical protein
MNTRNIDLTNIVLLILSCGLAYAVPFELFLFSYAVLGPLHYLTEISWLKKRDCFTNGKQDYVFLVGLCVVLTVIVLLGTYKDRPPVQGWHEFFVSVFGTGFDNFSNVTIYLAFFSSLAFILFKDWFYKGIIIALALLVGVLLQDAPPFLIFFGILLPTIIHVFVFTGLFMIYGALKNRSVTGYASVAVFLVCAVSFFVWRPVFGFYNITSYAQNAIFMEGKGMVNLNAVLINMFKMGQVTMDSLFHNSVGLSIGRFIAFAYTYHYLNWFSKTEVIKWHLVPFKWLVAVIVLWIFSVLLYIYDYKTGLMALYFLSLLHVFFEFPLNYRSVIGIWDETALMSGLKKPAVVKNKVSAPNTRKKRQA